MGDGATVRLGLIAWGDVPEELAQDLAGELPEALARGVSDDVDWQVLVAIDPLVADGALTATAMIDAARRRMIEDGLDLAICLTDLPLRIGRRPVVADASAMHRVALVSLPALGAVNLRRRAREAIVRLVAALLGDEPQRLARSVRRVDADDDDDIDARFVAAVVRGHLRLIAGMVRANRPWRLVAGLSRALAAALAAVVFALVTSDIWRVADALEWWQLVTLALGSIVATVAGLIMAHGLWERPADRASRERVVLFNVATTLTLALGVLSLYVALLLLALVGAVLLLDPSVVETTVRHDAGVGTYLRITWVIASLATVGGALGSALETDAAVREAAYGYRPERETERDVVRAREREPAAD